MHPFWRSRAACVQRLGLSCGSPSNNKNKKSNAVKPTGVRRVESSHPQALTFFLEKGRHGAAVRNFEGH